MSNSKSVLQALVEMSLKLGRPERDLVILGEGNTSALCDDGTFWVKASGAQLPVIDANGFDEECARVGRLHVDYGLDHGLDLGFDVVALVDHIGHVHLHCRIELAVDQFVKDEE